jgi:hypothetical protein
MLVINIAVASMLKNTQSQSAASIGYSGHQTMQITAASGAIATESYFANRGQDALATLNGVLSGQTEVDKTPYIYGGSKSGKAKIAQNQFFSSRLAQFDKDNWTSQFDISSGNSANGRDLRKAAAFYKMGNLTLRGDEEAPFGGSNAIYLGGNLQDGNNGMEVFGGATFEGNVKLQNKAAVFHGTAWVGGDIDIPNDKEIRFRENTYIKGKCDFHFMGNNGTIEPVFLKDAGFEGNINMHGGGLATGGNVWMNGASISTMNKDFTSAPGDGKQKSIFAASGMGAWSGGKWNTNAWGTGKVVKFDQPPPNGAPYDIPAKLNMSYESRKEPDLDISKIPAPLFKPASVATASGMNLSTQKLHEAYDDAAKKGELYNGHLVISIPPNSNINFPSSYSPPLFDKKVIFVLEEGARLNAGGRFYNSSENASTLIYVKPRAQLDEFGCSGLFRGLIYVDPKNNERQGLKWGDNSAVEGAMLLKG